MWCIPLFVLAEFGRTLQEGVGNRTHLFGRGVGIHGAEMALDE